ncbi:hypothetical protein CBL_08130 [Carabus blaptoides fortunei]
MRMARQSTGIMGWMGVGDFRDEVLAGKMVERAGHDTDSHACTSESYYEIVNPTESDLIQLFRCQQIHWRASAHAQLTMADRMRAYNHGHGDCYVSGSVASVKER